MSHSKEPSRRAVLSGAPAITAAGIVGGIGTAKADEVDPIFDVIERQAKALELEDELHEAMNARYPSERPLEAVIARTQGNPHVVWDLW
jgi:hypothetical protein